MSSQSAITSTASPTSLTPLELKELSKWEKVELLRTYRKGGARNATSVLLLAADVLAGSVSGIDSVELYNIYEQVVIAALECGRNDSARSYLGVLEGRFGRKSQRVMRLCGLCLEAEQKLEAAKEMYDRLLVLNPIDPFAVQRLSAMLKSEGRCQEAIQMLETGGVYVNDDGEEPVKHTFLEVHTGTIPEVYRELSYLYSLVGDVEKALFYAEETVLFEPTSYLAHLRVAELSFSVGKYEESAASYAQSLRLNHLSNNARSAYGLWMASGEMLKMYKRAASGGSKNSAEELAELEKQAQGLRAWSEAKLKVIYAGNPMLSVVEGMIQKV